MDIIMKSRNTDVDQHFRDCAEDKLTRLTKLDARASRIDVEVIEARNPRQAGNRICVELTCHCRRGVLRAAAAAADPCAALDLAVGKLDMQLRRAADRRRVHYGSRTPVSVAAATSPPAPGAASSG